MDGALPRRRAPRERDDAQLHRRRAGAVEPSRKTHWNPGAEGGSADRRERRAGAVRPLFVREQLRECSRTESVHPGQRPTFDVSKGTSHKPALPSGLAALWKGNRVWALSHPYAGAGAATAERAALDRPVLITAPHWYPSRVARLPALRADRLVPAERGGFAFVRRPVGRLLAGHRPPLLVRRDASSPSARSIAASMKLVMSLKRTSGLSLAHTTRRRPNDVSSAIKNLPPRSRLEAGRAATYQARAQRAQPGTTSLNATSNARAPLTHNSSSSVGALAVRFARNPCSRAARATAPA